MPSNPWCIKYMLGRHDHYGACRLGGGVAVQGGQATAMAQRQGAAQAVAGVCRQPDALLAQAHAKRGCSCQTCVAVDEGSLEAGCSEALPTQVDDSACSTLQVQQQSVAR